VDDGTTRRAGASSLLSLQSLSKINSPGVREALLPWSVKSRCHRKTWCLKAFVRGYADFLGLEAGTLSAGFLREIQPLERPIDPDLEIVEERKFGSGQWFTTAAVMLFVALALYLVGLR
jgi:hypothetical protein